MDQQFNPINQPEPLVPQSTPPSKFWQVLVVAVILVVVSLACGAYYWWRNYGSGAPRACTMEAKLCPDGSYVGRTGPDCEFAQCPADPTAGWPTHTSAAMGFAFKYPKEYSAPQERENYLSLISPLNPNRAPKMLELQDGELKIEIVVEPGQENDSVLKCWNDHNSGDGRILGQGTITIAGVSYELLTWEGLGTGQFTCVNHSGQRYLINKYPAETTRRNEYSQILSTFKFLN